MREAVSDVNKAIESTSKTELLRALQSEDARFTDLRPENTQWYMDILSKAIKDKAEHEVSSGMYCTLHDCYSPLEYRNLLY